MLTGLVEATALPYLGIRPDELSLDEKAEILFLDQGYAFTLDFCHRNFGSWLEDCETTSIFRFWFCH